jgi:uncharacterized membrane protein
MPSLPDFPLPDLAALALIVALAWATGRLTERPPAARPSVTILMNDYRRRWMREFVTRQPRIFDAAIIDSLRQGTAFFASACLIAIGAGVALIGNPGQLQALMTTQPGLTSPVPADWRLALVLAFLANALLKFLWANRLFGYCAVMMAAVPNDTSDIAACYDMAARAAEMNITAARSFNRGLRSIYYAVGAMGWLAGPAGLAAGAVFATTVMLRREFFSASRRIVAGS